MKGGSLPHGPKKAEGSDPAALTPCDAASVPACLVELAVGTPTMVRSNLAGVPVC